MTDAVPLAFYAPLKSPDHPTPSGDRTVARLLLRALAEAGFAPRLASRLRSFEPHGDAGRQAALAADGERDAERLARCFADGPAADRPRLWFTYHNYYKAPDHLGPAVAAALGIPYVVAEGSRAAKRADGPWRTAHAAAEAGLDRAALVFATTAADREALSRHRPPGQVVTALPPFLDLAEWPEPQQRRGRPDGPTRPDGPLRLATVAMMRPGDKLSSYRILADALGRAAAPWTLTVAGDGPARPEVERLFAPFADRVVFRGAERDRARLAALLSDADLFVWPAVNEAYGMAPLEAQACGCPVLAGRCGGVDSVVLDGETGLLARPGDARAFADALDVLAADRPRLAGMGRAARRFVRGERSLGAAAATLRSELGRLLGQGAAA